MKPAEIVRGEHLETLFTSMFMHANFIHIAGNMLYLWVFGDELEANYLGPVRFTIFYFVCGLAASALQIAVDPTSTVPNLGASGAIAGVLGGFQIVFPGDRILIAILVPFWIWSARLTSWVLIGIWFATQLSQRVRQHHVDRGGRRGLLRARRRVYRWPRARQAVRGGRADRRITGCDGGAGSTRNPLP